MNTYFWFIIRHILSDLQPSVNQYTQIPQQPSILRHTSGSLSDVWFDLTTDAESLLHVMLTFPTLNEISLDLKTNKHIWPPVSLQIMPVTYELNFLSKHIFIGGTLSFHDGKCHRCWSLIKNMIMSRSWFKSLLTMWWNEKRNPNRI